MLRTLADTLCELDVVENPRFAVGIVVISATLSDILVLPVWRATLLFPVVRQCRVYLWTLSLSLTWSKAVDRATISVILILQIYSAMSL